MQEQNLGEKIDQSKEKIQSTWAFFLKSLRDLGRQILNLRDGVDPKGTIQGIKKDVEFNGYNVWILICSIFIASIGLNTNSTAVIIGAMLISPLMGPILGMGLAIGTNDFRLLVKSMKNFGVMIVVSLITSALYFLIFPSYEVQSEILARTKPTILDVFVAIFGGMAGIIAGSRKEKTNVIPGVAIATALMPPLCTAGFGLATLNMQYLFGAFYLFTLNSVFICLTTYVFIKYFRFPLKEFLNQKREQRVKRLIMFFVLLAIIPSTFLFYSVLKESYFKGKAKTYIKEKIRTLPTQILKAEAIYTDTTNYIEVYVLGEPISQERISSLSAALKDYGLINTFLVDQTKLLVHQNENQTDELKGMISELETKFLKNSYEENLKLLEEKDLQINMLKKRTVLDTALMHQLQKEIKIQYPFIKEFAIASIDNFSLDSNLRPVEMMVLSFNKTPSTKLYDQFKKWVRVRLKKNELEFFKR